MSAASPAWIGVDVADGHMHLWVHDPRGDVLAQADGPVAALPAEDGFVAALTDLLSPYLSDQQRLPVIVAGLPALPASSLRPVPAEPLGGVLVLEVDDPRLELRAVPGLKQASPPQIMQGAETAIAGYLQAAPEFDGVICCLDAQSTWAHISAREVVSFQSFLTPVMAAQLSATAPLSKAVLGGGLDEDTFDAAVNDVMARPQIFATALAEISAQATIDGPTTDAGWSRLMGLLIGLELAGARAYWLGREVVILSDSPLAPLYARGLAAQGLTASHVSRRDHVRAGLQLCADASAS